MQRNILKEAANEIGTSLELGKPVIFRDLSLEDVSVLYATAHALYAAGDYHDAEKIFRQLTLCKPLDEKHWHGLGSTLQMQKAYPDALTAWSMAALIGDDSPLPHFHAAECLFSTGDAKQALKALHEARKYIDLENKEHKALINQIEILEKIWQSA
ncbi:MAG: SycD/LcrH family type III secretion system chaperone [Simkaniaceae bacterium]|nr:SycD/LcrH family type III secretion system chaperone [Simkaniaceae bacterium]